ncbi:hypothetical protein GQ44DRAFT_494062 [Phaeosphaeriaceae sp. PMI808]|nr:hypothetical protein GQ44DRAFT_494062 [Phaeosphaeriaceae sp. PMI808]
MQYLTLFPLTCALIGATNAIPTLSGRSSTQCPGQSYLTPELNCPSGFFGCAPYEKSSEICNGSKRFYNDCTASPGLGSFYLCHSEGYVTFIGCTTNSNICSTITPTTELPPTSNNPSPQSRKCPVGTWYAGSGECSSGFIGCTGLGPEVCPGQKRFWGSCPPNHGNYYNCANGFLGCTTDAKVCR